MENLVLYGKTIAFLATDGFEQIELVIIVAASRIESTLLPVESNF